MKLKEDSGFVTAGLVMMTTKSVIAVTGSVIIRSRAKSLFYSGWLLMLLLLLGDVNRTASTFTAVSKGCFVENLLNPNMNYIGGYISNTAYNNATMCQNQCDKVGLPYAGLEQAKYCFCSTNITGLTTNGTCSVKCLNLAICGGAAPGGTLQVWQLIQPAVQFLSMNMTGGTVYQIGQTVTLSVKTSHPYETNWGDGTITYTNQTTHAYTMAGMYTIFAYLSINAAIMTAPVTVVVAGNPSFTMSCPPIISLGVPSYCNFTNSLQGYNYTFNLAMGSALQSLQMQGPLPDASMVMYGTGRDVANAGAGTVARMGTDYILLSNSYVATAGKIVSVWVHGTTASFSVVLMSMTPVCSTGVYCAGSCQSACTSVCAAAPYCVGYRSCSAGSCTSTVSTNVTAYVTAVLRTVTVTSSSTGIILPIEPPIEVKEGSYLGFYTTAILGKTETGGSPKVHGDLRLTTAGGYVQTLTFTHNVRFQVQEHPTVGFVPPIVCREPAPVPKAQVPVPYTAASKAFIYNGTFSINLQVTSKVTGVSVSNVSLPLCQMPLGNVTYPVEVWMRYLSNITYNISMINGSSIFMNVIINGVNNYYYHDNAATVALSLQPVLFYGWEGLYNLTGTAMNAISNYSWTSAIHVVPPITSNWVLTAVCPCYDLAQGFPMKLDWPSAPHPPWNATVNLTYTATTANGPISGIFVAPVLHDFSTFDNGSPAGASGTAKPLALNYITAAPMPGNYTVMAGMRNEVSSQNFTTTILVEPAIRNVSGKITWLQGTVEMQGSGAFGEIFITNMTNIIRPTTVTGIPLKWNLYVYPTGANITINNTVGCDFRLPLNVAGAATFIISGYNTVQGWVSSPPINIALVNTIEGLVLSDDGLLGKVNVSKAIIATYTIVTPVSCLVVDYGDMSVLETFGEKTRCTAVYPNAKYMGQISTPKILNHIYTKEGSYMVTGTAWDHSVTLVSTIQEVVADVPCDMPIVSIVNAATKVYSAPSNFMSYPYTLETNTTIVCNRTVPAIRYWSISLVDNATGLVLLPVPIEGILKSWNYSSLTVDPLFLPLGTYLITFTVNVMASTVVALIRSAFTYLNVIATPLSAVIIDSSVTSLSRGFQQTLAMKPGNLSSDPDEPGVPLTNVSWWCRQILPTLEVHQKDSMGFPISYNIQPLPAPGSTVGRTGGGCFGVGPGQINYYGNNLTLQISSSYLESATYEWLAVVSKDTRRAMAAVKVQVVATPPPLVSISCINKALCYPQSDGQLVNPTIDLGLTGGCIAECSSTLFYKWSVESINGEIPVIQQDGCNAGLSSCPQSYSTDMISPNLIITPNFYKFNPTFIKYVVRLTIITQEKRIGYSQVTIKKNLPPAGGKCILDFSGSIYGLLTTFSIVCSNWVDPEALGISAYNFYSILYNADGTNTSTAMASISQATLSTVLPVGTFQLYVELWDVLNSYTVYSVKNLTTLMPTEAQFKAFNTSDKLQYISSTGDSTKLAMFIHALNSVNALANWTSLSSMGNKSEQELNALLLTLSDSTAQQLSALQNTAGATNINQLNVYAGVLDSSVSGILQNDKASYTVGMDSRDKTLEILEGMTNSLFTIPIGSAKQYGPFLESALNTMTALTQGINTILKNGAAVPPADQLQAAKMDYDVDVSQYPDMKVPTNLQEMYAQNVIVLTKQQSISQTQRMAAVVQSVSQAVLDKLSVGQSVAVTASSGATIILAQIGEETLKQGKRIPSSDGNSALLLPKNFCPSKRYDPYSNCRRVFGITFVTWPVTMKLYSETSSFLSPKSHILEVHISSQGLNIDIPNNALPIEMEIARDFSHSMPSPLSVNVTNDINTAIPFVYHCYNVSIPQAAYIIEITPSVLTEKLVLVIGFNSYPLPGKFLSSYLVSNLTRQNDTYSLLVDTTTNGNRTGKFIAGIGKLIGNVNNTNFAKKDLDPKFASNYKFRVMVDGCYFFNETSTLWQADESMKVIDSSYTRTKCQTSHLSQFASGFLPSINLVDFDLITANLGFVDNFTLYITLILTLLMYVIMMIWGHFKDKKDVERQGAIPLPDNKVEDKYIYEVTFHTGPDSEAPCESNIFFIVSGDIDETETKKLPPPTLNLYRRYDRNTFVMTTPNPLGPLHYLRVFHDNSGRLPYDSWQLDRVVIRDLQTLEQYNFETNAWLAINRGDGLVDRTFLCANNNEDETEFSQRMYIQTNRSANQDHMWMSMFLRPVGSRFGRKERVTVCATFLYVSMLFSAMFYVAQGETSASSEFKIGPIPISSNEVLTGFVVLIIAYPLVIFLSTLFKRARPKNLKRCRALNTIENQRMDHYLKAGEEEAEAEEHSRVETMESEESLPKVLPIVKCLPWWTRVVAWLIAILTMAGSIFIVWSYGITWGETTTVKWFASFFSSFLLSVIISQWVKVIIVSIFASTCNRADLTVEDIDCDEELPNLKQDEKWLVMQPLDPSAPRHVHGVEGVIQKGKESKRLRRTLTKEREMKYVVRGIFMYVLFLVILLVILNDKTDDAQFLLNQKLRTTFVKPGKDPFDVSNNATNVNAFWQWLDKYLLFDLRAQRDYNGDPPYGRAGFLNDYNNRIIGHAILRQVRNQQFACVVPAPMSENILDCSGTRGVTIEENGNFCANWSRKPTGPQSCSNAEFIYETPEQVQTFAQVGQLGTYGGGGYVFHLAGTQNAIKDRILELKKMKWIDKRTRAVFLEFSVYNANVNLFSTCSLIFEFTEGGIAVSWSFLPVRLLTISSQLSSNMAHISEALFVVATLFFTIRELMEIKKKKCEYFAEYWNLAELLMITASYVGIGIFFYKYFLTQSAVTLFKETKGNAYIRMDYAVLADVYYSYLLGCIMFFSVLKLIKVLQFNKRMNVLALTIGLCWNELSYFFIAFAVIFFAFCCLFYYFFFTTLKTFSNVLTAVQQCFAMMMGKCDYSSMTNANALAPLLYFIFSLMNTIVLINIMLAIILKAFAEVKADLLHKENQYDVMDYMWAHFKKMISQQPNAVHQLHIDQTDKRGTLNIQGDKDDEQLPEKVDQLLEYINDTYFDGKLEASNSRAMKVALARQAKRQTQFVSEKRKVVFSSDE